MEQRQRRLGLRPRELQAFRPQGDCAQGRRYADQGMWQNFTQSRPGKRPWQNPSKAWEDQDRFFHPHKQWGEEALDRESKYLRKEITRTQGHRNKEYGPKTIWQHCQEKEWRPRRNFQKLTKVLERKEGMRTEKVSLMIDNKSWNDSVAFFRERGLFVKCFGDWSSVGKMKGWCAENWKCKSNSKPFQMGFSW